MITTLRVGIVGAGLMGHGIAQVYAAAGHRVVVTDVHAPTRDAAPGRIRANLRDLGLDEGAADRVSVSPDIAGAVAGADVVVEAAVEDLDAKRAIFAAVEAAAPPHAMLCSNTSVIPISAIMRDLADGSRALGTHWWNPPFLVPLVEVIGTERTAPAVIDRAMAIHAALGKVPVRVRRDVPGFIGNRLQHALWREAIALVEEGVCDGETVDTVVKSSFGRRLAVLGPIENADLVGLELTLAIHRTVLPAIDSRPAPSPLLERLIAEGKLGMRSGEGLRRWAAGEPEAVRLRVLDHLRGTRDRDG